MRWLDRVVPEPMERVACVCPQSATRAALVALARVGNVELETLPGPGDPALADALAKAQQIASQSSARLASEAPDPIRLAAQGRADLLAGEIELERRASAAVEHGPFSILVGWVAKENRDTVAAALAPLGATVVPLPPPPWREPPTALPSSPSRDQFHSVVDTYGTAHYRDVDPTPFAAFSFVLMFGMMFGDLGDGLVLAVLSLGVRLSRWPLLEPVRRVWRVPAAAGLTAAFFGLLYGEAFGPTGWVPTLWLRPLENPMRLLVAGLAAGAGLLGLSYVLGTVNRFREGGLGAALVAGSGLAGSAMFAGAGSALGGVLLRWPGLIVLGLILLVVGAVLVFLGLLAHSGTAPTGIFQAFVELFDTLLGLGVNAISFARLAAFGMVHAALGWVVWMGFTGLWRPGFGAVVALAVFGLGHVLAFVLEAVVAGIQALRLEYYELFSRIFAGEGRPFRPWSMPVVKEVI